MVSKEVGQSGLTQKRVAISVGVGDEGKHMWWHRGEQCEEDQCAQCKCVYAY